MAKKNTASQARTVASEGRDVRDRVRSLTVKALRDRNFGMKDVSKVVGDVLNGASQGLEDAVPKSQKNVLRQVFDGLNEAVDAAAGAGMSAARSARDRGERVVKKDAPAAARQVRQANDQFLSAAGSFARKLSGEMKEELQELVAKARRATPKVKSGVRSAATAADGRLIELGGETVRTGAKVARRTVGGVMMAAGGLLEGLADSINPPTGRSQPAASNPKKSTTRSKKRTRKS